MVFDIDVKKDLKFKKLTAENQYEAKMTMNTLTQFKNRIYPNPDKINQMFESELNEYLLNILGVDILNGYLEEFKNLPHGNFIVITLKIVKSLQEDEALHVYKYSCGAIEGDEDNDKFTYIINPLYVDILK